MRSPFFYPSAFWQSLLPSLVFQGTADLRPEGHGSAAETRASNSVPIHFTKYLKSLDLFLQTSKTLELGVVVHYCNSSSQEAKARGSVWIQDQPGLHKFQDTLHNPSTTIGTDE